MKVTDVLVQCLENEGVEYIFGISGKENLDFVDSLSRSKQIQFVNVRHEQGAALARQHKESHQYIDIVKMTEPVTKWCAQIKDPQTLPEYHEKRFEIFK